jgi:uncharacterized membrane protein YkvA (DUF1232 family)
MSLQARCSSTPRNRSFSWQLFFRKHSEKAKQQLSRLAREIRLFGCILQDPDVPWYAKTVAGCSLGYLLSPVQLIPTFIPIIGLLDDLAVLWLGIKLVRRLTPAEILHQYEDRERSTVLVMQADNRKRMDATPEAA